MLLDLSTMMWQQVVFTGSLPPVRASHSSTVIAKNKVRDSAKTVVMFILDFNIPVIIFICVVCNCVCYRC